MEFGQKGADLPGEANDQGQYTTGSDAEFGGAATGETGMTVSNTSALDHVPPATGTPIEAGSAGASTQEGIAVDRVVGNALRRIDEAQVVRTSNVEASNILTTQIEELIAQRDVVDEQASAAERFIDGVYSAARIRTWAGMPKGEDGYAHGAKYLQRAVELSPSTALEDRTIRSGRVAAAVDANRRIVEGVQTIVGYYADNQPRFQIGVPPQDGFVIGQQPDGGHRFLVGIDEAVIPVDEAWVAAPADTGTDDSADTQVAWGVRPRIAIETGDQVQPFLQAVSEGSANEYLTSRRTYERGSRPPYGMPSGEADDLENRERRSGAILVNAVNAAREAGIPIYDEATPVTGRKAVVDALTERLLDSTTVRSPRHSFENAVEAGQALAHVYPPNARRSLADYLITSSRQFDRRMSGGHDRAPIVALLTEVCGIERSEAWARLDPTTRRLR